MGGNPIIFKVDKSISQLTLNKIYDILSINKGNKPVFLEIKDKKHKFLYKFNLLSSEKIIPVVEKLLELEISA